MTTMTRPHEPHESGELGADPATHAASGATDSHADVDPVPDVTESMDLVLRAQRGDGAALNSLLTRYQDRLYRIARIRLGSDLRRHLDSAEIVNRTMFVASRKLPDFEPRDKAALLRWLERILVNQIRDARDYHQADKRDMRRTLPILGIAQDSHGGSIDIDPPGREPTPTTEISRAELREIFDTCVEQLDPDHREVILLRDYEEGSWEWITEQMGRPNIHATEQLYFRAKIKLGKLLRTRLRS